MRRKIVAGNWKMNNNQSESNILIHSIIEKNSENSSCNIYVSPSFPFLKDAVLTCSKSNIKVLSQNVSHLTDGALTGDVSCTMLKSIGINSVIIGHSERRTIFGESNEVLLKKIKRMFEEYRVPDKYCGRQRGKFMWINGQKIELPDNDPGGEHE